ncbi:---NA--- : [Gemmataceae bacterium]|nr:---NA--- : [Gemmataceae bacterium]VTT97713.1 ---NA--- : [Gemmataceae bacterium]
MLRLLARMFTNRGKSFASAFDRSRLRTVLGVASLEDRTVPAAIPLTGPNGGAWVKIDTLTIATRTNQNVSTGVTSNVVLDAGVNYLAVASGTARIANDATGFADAEFIRYNKSTGPQDGSSPGYAWNNHGVRIAGVSGGDTGGNFWGGYEADHVYFREVTGQGTRVTGWYSDIPGYYGDNSGTLTVELYEEASANLPPVIDLDVTNNGTLNDPEDGVAKYSPGYKGTVAVLTPTVEQQMKVIVQGLTPDAKYTIFSTGTSKYAGIASNLNSDPTKYPSGAGEQDFVLIDAGGNAKADDKAIEITADANGNATVEIRCRDFGGKTAVRINNAAGQEVARLNIPLDTDQDGLPDFWEKMYSGPGLPAGFVGFDSAKKNSVAGVEDGDRDDDKNEGGKDGKNVGDRIPAFDEYRGFFASGTHTRTNPVVKQVFVYSPDKDPYLAAGKDNADGLNLDLAKGESVKVGVYADDLDAEILLIQQGEFDAGGADGKGKSLGDVNYNSPRPYGDIKQKYIWVATTIDYYDTSKPFGLYGYTTFDLLSPTKGPNHNLALGPEPGFPGARPAQYGYLATAKAALVNLGMIRTDVAFIDSDGSATLQGVSGKDVLDQPNSTPKYIMSRGNGGLAADPLRDPNRFMANADPVAGQAKNLSLFYFAAADKVRWNDRNGDGHWDRGDELWIDIDSNKQYSPGDKVIFDYDNNLAVNTVGVLLDHTSEFRYVRKDRTNTVGSYTDGDAIYTAFFNKALYTASRDVIIAHESVGHSTEQPHDEDYNNYSMMSMQENFYISASGYLMKTPVGSFTYIDPPTTFNDKSQDAQLQLRENT